MTGLDTGYLILYTTELFCHPMEEIKDVYFRREKVRYKAIHWGAREMWVIQLPCALLLTSILWAFEKLKDVLI